VTVINNEPMTAQSERYHRAAGTGPMYWGLGDLYRFLVTGADSGGAYFAMEAIVPTGGGPPPHIHHAEDETVCIVEGKCSGALLRRDAATRVRPDPRSPR
jgi:hypothetical protein